MLKFLLFEVYACKIIGFHMKRHYTQIADETVNSSQFTFSTYLRNVSSTTLILLLSLID